MLTFASELTRPRYRFVAWIAALAALGGFLFGFDTGVVGSAEPYFSKTLGIGSFGESWVVGSLLLGAVAGAAAAGYLADSLSRKWTKFVGGCIFTGAGLASAFAPNVEILCVIRFVLGLGVGTASFVAPMYISEQSPKKLRGGMTALNQVMITFGIMVAYLSDYALSGIGSDNWRWMFAMEAIPGAALAVAMVFVPHTPRWLIQRDRDEEAKAVLDRTRPDADVEQEIEDIKGVAGRQKSTGIADVVRPELRPMLVVGVILAFLQQAVGINAVIYFGAQLLKFMGHTTNTAVYEAITLGVVNFAGAVVAVLVLDWIGRRKMLVAGSIGMVLGLGSLGWFFSNSSSFVHQHALLGLGCVLLFLFTFELSLGPVFWLLISELFPLRVRSKSMALCTMVNWAANFLVSYFFLTMTQDLGRDGTFWLFGAFAVCSAVFGLLRVPETKDRSLEDIESDLGARDAASRQAA